MNTKRDVGDLAAFGGRPAFLRPLCVGRPNTIDRSRLFDRLSWSLDNQWLSNGGPLVREFEDRIAELAGVDHCVATCNGTAALQLLAQAAELTGEVAMPSLTFIATAHAMRWVGLEPVFVDIDPNTGGIDVDAAAAAMNERTSALLGVHLWGHPCDVDGLSKVAAGRGVPLFLDAAHALGCTSAGRPVGGFGAAEIFSFHATKVVSTFEGGAVVTDDADLAARVRTLQNFGIGGAGNPAGGTNAKLSEAGAAMGLTSLDAFDDSIRHNRVNHDLYRTELAETVGLTVRRPPAGQRSNHQYAILEIDAETTGIDRDLLLRVLRAEQVEARPYFSPACHEQEPYRSRRAIHLPHTERLARRVLALPTGTTVAREDVRRVCDVIRLAASEGHAVTERWRRRQHDEAAACSEPRREPRLSSVG